MQPMKIQIPNEMFSPAEFMHLDEEFTAEPITSGPDTVTFPERLACSVDITNTGDAFLVTGYVRGAAATQCARCLEDVAFDIDGQIEGYFLINSESEEPEDMEGDEFDYLPEDKKIDLAPLIESAILLDLPRIPLCSDECKGLCPKCGANLNTGTCGCEDSEEEIPSDNPFAVLKNIDFS